MIRKQKEFFESGVYSILLLKLFVYYKNTSATPPFFVYRPATADIKNGLILIYILFYFYGSNYFVIFFCKKLYFISLCNLLLKLIYYKYVKCPPPFSKVTQLALPILKHEMTTQKNIYQCYQTFNIFLPELIFKMA